MNPNRGVFALLAVFVGLLAIGAQAAPAAGAIPEKQTGTTTATINGTPLDVEVCYWSTYGTVDYNVTVPVHVNVTNQGTRSMTIPLTLYRNRTPLERRTLAVGPDESATVAFHPRMNRSGTYRLTVNQLDLESSTADLGVVGVMRKGYYIAKDYWVDTATVLGAIESWQEGNITTSRVLQIVEMWANGPRC